MSVVSSGIQPPGNLTPFQFQCASEVARLLGEKGLSFTRELIDGKEESYLVYKVEGLAEKPLTLYVYEDEAGFFLGERWHIWEVPDYNTSEKLMSSFLDGLRTTIEKSLRDPLATSS